MLVKNNLLISGSLIRQNDLKWASAAYWKITCGCRKLKCWKTPQISNGQKTSIWRRQPFTALWNQSWQMERLNWSCKAKTRGRTRVSFSHTSSADFFHNPPKIANKFQRILAREPSDIFIWPCICSVYQYIRVLTLRLHTLLFDLINRTHYICGRWPLCAQVDSTHTAGESVTQKTNDLLLFLISAVFALLLHIFDFAWETDKVWSEMARPFSQTLS